MSTPCLFNDRPRAGQAYRAMRPTALLAGTLLACAPYQGNAAIEWNAPWNVRANGQHLSVETFTSVLPPDRVVRKLVQGNARYDRYLVADGRMLLSGLANGAHWVAEVAGHPDGAQGYVSALYFDPSHAPAAQTLARAEGHMEELPAPQLAGTGLRRQRDFQFDGAAAAVSILAAPDPGSLKAAATVPIDPDEAAVMLVPDAYPSMAVAVSVPGG